MITGCVQAGANAISVTDEKDQRRYALSGNTTGVKPGDRMALEGKRHKESGQTVSFETLGIRRDLGACTVNSYVKADEDFAEFFHKRPDELGRRKSGRTGCIKPLRSLSMPFDTQIRIENGQDKI